MEKNEGKLTELAMSCVGTAFYNPLRKERWKEKVSEEEEEDVSSYSMTSRKQEGTGI